MAKKPTNAYFEGIHKGMMDVIDAMESGKKLTVRKYVPLNPPKPIPPKKIKMLRTQQFKMSQHVFADLLNVSVKTVQAWEQNRTKPTSSTLRLLQIAAASPDIVIRAATRSE